MALLLNFHQDLLKTTSIWYATHFGDYNDGMAGKRTLDKRKIYLLESNNNYGLSQKVQTSSARCEQFPQVYYFHSPLNLWIQVSLT